MVLRSEKVVVVGVVVMVVMVMVYSATEKAGCARVCLLGAWLEPGLRVNREGIAVAHHTRLPHRVTLQCILPALFARADPAYCSRAAIQPARPTPVGRQSVMLMCARAPLRLVSFVQLWSKRFWFER